MSDKERIKIYQDVMRNDSLTPDQIFKLATDEHKKEVIKILETKLAK